MACCTYGDTADQQFTTEKVATELRRYRRKGPGRTACLLRDGLVERGLAAGTLIDVGAGVGALTLALLDVGITRATVVEASSAYLAAASDESINRGRSGSIRFVYGDFVQVAGDLPSAAVVTLDRVVCCYPSYEPLLQQAARHADRAVALSYPRDRWYVRAAMAFENWRRRRRANPFRVFVHDPRDLWQVLVGAGFELQGRRQTPIWSADVFVKAGPAAHGAVRDAAIDGDQRASG